MDTKSLLLSKTVRGIVITLSVTVAKMFGIELIITDQPELVDGIIQIIGLLITLLGRVQATKKLVLF